MESNPYDEDDLTIEMELESGSNSQLEDRMEAAGGTPHELFYQQLCDEFGPELVDYTQRCFYLRLWKQVHGEYPCTLDYLRLRSLLAIEEEQNLKQSYEMYVSNEKSRNVDRQTTQQHHPGGHMGGGVLPNIHRNTF